MKYLIIIWLGGGIGSVLRYLTQAGANRLFTIPFPVGTFIVNITGCFLIGLFYSIAGKQGWMNYEWRLFLITGLCGGFTTFSSFSYEGISLFKQGHYAYVLLYIVLSVVLGLLATVGGAALIK